jgi:hypothetical protein
MIVQSPHRPLVILKSKKEGKYGRRHKVEYDNVPPINQITDHLRRYNEFLCRFQIDVPDTVKGLIRAEAKDRKKELLDAFEFGDLDSDDPSFRIIDFQATKLHRVFNDVDPENVSLDYGGRFYGGWWQSVKKTHRPCITIDGEPTVEYDYSSFHPRMLYHYMDLPAYGDLYVIPALIEAANGFDPAKLRKTTKKLLNILINATRRQITRNLKRPREELLDHWEIELPDHLSVTDVIKMIEEHHAPIRAHFGTRAGLWLQRLDSRICEYILVAGMNDWIPVLPIHDSFVVRKQDANWVHIKMIEAYRELLGDHRPKIERVGNYQSPLLGTHKPRKENLYAPSFEEIMMHCKG